MTMHSPPLEGNYCDEHGKAVKPATVQDCNRHIRCSDKSARMTKTLALLADGFGDGQ